MRAHRFKCGDSVTTMEFKAFVTAIGVAQVY